MRPVLVAACLVLSACADARPPEPPTRPEPSSAAPAPLLPARPSAATPRAGYAGLPVGPAPRVPYVVGQVYVDADGTRSRIQRGYEYGVTGFVRVARGAVLVEDADNFEGYTSVRLVQDGRATGRWSTYGGITVGRDGVAAFGEATSSEAVPKGPNALHLLVGGRHLVQEVPWHPDVLAIVGRRVVFEYRFADDGDTGPFVTDLVSPPERWRRAVPPRSFDVPLSVEEPGGARLDLVTVARRSGLVRTRLDGTREVAAPFVARPEASLATSGHSLELVLTP